MDGKHPISSKHSKNTQPGVCVQCLRNNSCDIHLQWVFVSVCQLQHCGAETAPGWEQLQGDEKNSTISFWDLSVPFYFDFFFSEFISPPRSWQEYFCKLCALSFGWKALSETCVNFSRGTQPERQNLRRQTGRRKSRKRSWKWHELFRDTFDQLTDENTTSEWGGGGNAVSWSKQPLSLIIITELQFDLEPHQDSGRSGSMESLTLRWINEGIIMRFCKTHSCVRGQKHPIVLQPWQENLAVNTLVLKLGL